MNVHDGNFIGNYSQKKKTKNKNGVKNVSDFRVIEHEIILCLRVQFDNYGVGLHLCDVRGIPKESLAVERAENFLDTTHEQRHYGNERRKNEICDTHTHV